MSRSVFRTFPAGLSLTRVAALTALCTLLQLPLPSEAEPLLGASTATGRFQVKLVILPVFKVLEVTPVKDGYEYRVWTNTQSMVIGGREYRFTKVGETTLKVDGRVSDIDKQLNLDRRQGLAWRSVVRAGTAMGTGADNTSSVPASDPVDIHTVTVTY